MANDVKNIFCVLNFPTKEKPALLDCRPFDALGKYAIILHENDVDEEGKPKTPHCHFLLQSIEGHSFNTWVSMLSLAFKLPKNCVSIKVADNVRSCLRYLTHIDYKDKFQYDRKDIVTNDPDGLTLAFTEKPKKLGDISVEQFLACKDVTTLVREYGANLAKQAIPLWRQLKEEEAVRRWEADEIHILRAKLRHIYKAMAKLAERFPVEGEVRKEIAQILQVCQFDEIDFVSEEIHDNDDH